MDNITNIKFGKDEGANVIALYVDASTGTGWWYEGGGLIRHNYLMRANPTHFVEDSYWAHSNVRPYSTKTPPSTLHVEAEVFGATDESLTARAIIFDADAAVVGQALRAVSGNTVSIPVSLEALSFGLSSTICAGRTAYQVSVV